MTFSVAVTAAVMAAFFVPFFFPARVHATVKVYAGGHGRKERVR